MIKPIPNFPDYFASDDGSIYSMKPRYHHSERPKIPRKLKPMATPSGYLRVCLQVKDVKHMKSVSDLVLSTFVSKRPKGEFACHGVNGKNDNSIKNLYWATPKQNMLDKLRDGTMPFGDTHKSSKLNGWQVRIIRRSYGYWNSGGLSTPRLAKIFNVSEQAIWRIVHRISWRHI